jgi:hypothetical protein
MVVSVPVGTVRGVTQVGSDSSAGVLSTPGAAVVPGWSDAVVMQMVRRAFFTAIKLTSSTAPRSASSIPTPEGSWRPTRRQLLR